MSENPEAAPRLALRPSLEAVLMVTDQPLDHLSLAAAVGHPPADVEQALTELAATYDAEGRGFELRHVGGGWRFYSREQYAPAVERFVLGGQQARLTQAALETLAGSGIPGKRLLPGTGSCALPEAVRLSRVALEMDVPGVLVLPPFYYKGVSDDGLFQFFAELIERIADPRLRVYLYHFPQMTGVGFSLPLIERLLEAYPGVIAGTKDSAGDWDRIETVCREFPDLDVFAGTERYLLDTLRHGGAGCISATVNVTSRAARQVHDAYEAGREDEAEALQERLTDLRLSLIHI